MKVFSFSALYLIKSIFADDQNLEQLLDAVTKGLQEVIENNPAFVLEKQAAEAAQAALGDKSSDFISDLFDSVPNFGLRNLGILTSGEYQLPGWGDIHQYGCWCNFNNFQHGRGAPVDRIDGHCKSLHDNYLCALEETKSANLPICQPDKDHYETGMAHFLITNAILFKILDLSEEANNMMSKVYRNCEQLNGGPGSCLAGACKAEAKFIFEIQPDVSSIWFPNGYEKVPPKKEYRHDRFDFNGECNKSSSQVDANCCGKVPHASRYNSLLGKECCLSAGEVFNAVNQCCGSSGVDKIGQCD